MSYVPGVNSHYESEPYNKLAPAIANISEYSATKTPKRFTESYATGAEAERECRKWLQAFVDAGTHTWKEKGKHDPFGRGKSYMVVAKRGSETLRAGIINPYAVQTLVTA